MPKRREKPDSPETAFATVLRNRRTELGMMQLDVAIQSGFDASYISKLEKGQRQPTLRTILRLAKVLRMEPWEMVRIVAELLGDSE